MRALEETEPLTDARHEEGRIRAASVVCMERFSWNAASCPHKQLARVHVCGHMHKALEARTSRRMCTAFMHVRA